MFEIDELPFVIAHGKIHDLSCFKNSYTYIDNKQSASVNIACLNLKYCNKIKKIAGRAGEIDKHTNHIYMNYNQLVNKISLYKNRLRDYHLKCMQKDFLIISCRNKMSLYKRFVTLLSSKDVSRVRQLISVCINNGSGIKTMIRKFLDAANNVYRPKGFTENEIDLAYLTLRIGGPALLYAFSKHNILPTASFIYKVNRFLT